MMRELEIMEIKYNGLPVRIGFNSDEQSNITAYIINESDTKDQNEIGNIETEESENGEVYLSSIDVNKNYRNLGIGKKLVCLAKKYLNLSKVACVQESECYHFSLTPDGEFLIASCVRAGIIDKNMCVFSGSDILDGDKDPGYWSQIVHSALSSMSQTINQRTSFFQPNSDNDSEYERNKAKP